MLISIIVPVYNMENFLSKCLDSLKNQSYRNLEIILVNDGSTDDSGRICTQYAKEDSRFTVIHKKNGGVSSARNTGLQAAKGQYIGFVDPDDWVDLYMFEKLYRLIKEYKSDISICGYYMEDATGSLLNSYNPGAIQKLNRNEALNNILVPNGIQGFVCNKLFSAALLKEQQPLSFDPSIHFGEDLLFCCEAFLRCETLVYDPQPHYHYIMHQNNATQAQYSVKRLTLLNALDKIIDKLAEEERIQAGPYKNFYMHTNISLLMYGMHEKKSSRDIRKQLKEKASNYKLRDLTDVSVKLSCAIVRMSITLFYFIWNVRQTLNLARQSLRRPSLKPLRAIMGNIFFTR